MTHLVRLKIQLGGSVFEHIENCIFFIGKTKSQSLGSEIMCHGTLKVTVNAFKWGIDHTFMLTQLIATPIFWKLANGKFHCKGPYVWPPKERVILITFFSYSKKLWKPGDEGFWKIGKHCFFQDIQNFFQWVTGIGLTMPQFFSF